MSTDEELAHEQRYVDGLFRRLDDEVAAANIRLHEIQANVDPANPKAEALVARETEYHALNEKLDRLNLAQLGLVFGRIDIETSDPENPVPGAQGLERRYVGRMGLDDRQDHYRTLLLDWRAPMARPFYLATTAHPEGVHLRRHIRTTGRIVTRVDDELLSGVAANNNLSGVGGEAALYDAMERARTGHMRNIVETIQREQDEIIRDSTRGVMVVEGGPGTGKTAVALHRVAYLLYTWREQLSRTGVLIVGPNRTFLDYISRVLPELGETGVVLATIGELYPGIVAEREDSLLTREIKGSAEMIEILAQAVRAYQLLPDAPLRLRVDSLELSLSPETVRRARTRARRSRRPHNDARALFREAALGALAQQLAERIGADPLGGENLLSTADIAQLHDDLATEPSIIDALDELWPELTPERVLRDLLSSTERIAVAASDYDEETQTALYRPTPLPWSVSDIALLDELAVLIGRVEENVNTEEWNQELEEAQVALDILESSSYTDNDDEFDAEYLQATDVIDAATLARRQEESDHRTTAQRARTDLEWAYGHVIVDEAQELTPMEWRMIFRRCPSHWMTLVGDPAQTSSPAGVDRWEEALAPFVDKRFRCHQLTVNYRTPQEVMAVANRVLARIAPHTTPAQAIRKSEQPVLRGGSLSERVAQLQAADPTRSIAVIEAASVASFKGLEFDHVIIVDPAAILTASPQGYQDLYVAMTRATQSLTLIGEGAEEF